jgi:hypothetical protein
MLIVGQYYSMPVIPHPPWCSTSRECVMLSTRDCTGIPQAIKADCKAVPWSVCLIVDLPMTLPRCCQYGIARVVEIWLPTPATEAPNGVRIAPHCEALSH